MGKSMPKAITQKNKNKMGTKLLSMWRKLYSYANKVFFSFEGWGGELLVLLELQVSSSIQGLYFPIPN
jgi:hypothetical protein